MGTRRWNVAVAVALLTLLGTAAIYYFHHLTPVELPRSLSSLPGQLDGWVGEPASLQASPFRLAYTDEEFVRLYRGPSGEAFGLYVGYFRSQDANRKLVDSQSRRLADGAEALYLQRSADSPPRISRTLLSQNGKRWSVYYWFDINGRIVANRYAAKLYILYDAFRHRRTNGALVVVFSERAVAEGQPKPSASESVFLPNLVRAVHSHLSSRS
jgi:EpsI family protein